MGLLALVTFSYEQTIHAYPGGGGAYIVARDNLGVLAAQVAGAALLMDYILTVAVSISSGVAQMTSAFPALFEHRTAIAVGFVAIVMLINLRGVKESGLVFAVPTYFFVATMFLTVGTALLRSWMGVLGPVPDPPPLEAEPARAVGLFLILHAFSSGTTALTGVEAISNGILGISNYGGRANNLMFTAEDARRAYQAMVRGAAMRESDGIILTDQQATLANVRRAVQDVGSRAGLNDMFVFFYSGHGGRVPRSGPFQASDPDNQDETVVFYDADLRDDDMNGWLAPIRARASLLILDACFSGGFSKDVISAPGRMGLFSSEEDVTSGVAVKFRAGGYLAQFILEAAVLCEVGGVIGVVCGILGGNATAYFLKLATDIPIDWIVIGLVICSIVGIVFGTYPAYKAANLDPLHH